MARSHEGLVAMVEDHGKVATGQVLAEWLATDGDDEEIEAWLDRNELGLRRGRQLRRFEPMQDLERDQQLLMEFANIAGSVSQDDDPKLADLVEQLVTIAEEHVRQRRSRRGNKRKVLLFSYYADTVDWIFDFLKQVTDPDSPSHDPRLLVFRGRIASVSGQRDKADVLFGFAPKRPMRPKGKDDLYDIVVSTDVLAEGVNLQQARHVINYDLPWKQHFQRHGRIDRLLSPHAEVFIRCFFPTEKSDLDRLLTLEDRLRRKATQAHKIFGGMNVISGEQLDVHYASTCRETPARKPGTVPAERSPCTLGEEFRQQLRQAMANKTLMRDVEELPWGAGSGFTQEIAEPGWVFCARVADHGLPYSDLYPSRTWTARQNLSQITRGCWSPLESSSQHLLALPVQDRRSQTHHVRW